MLFVSRASLLAAASTSPRRPRCADPEQAPAGWPSALRNTGLRRSHAIRTKPAVEGMVLGPEPEVVGDGAMRRDDQVERESAGHPRCPTGMLVP